MTSEPSFVAPHPRKRASGSQQRDGRMIPVLTVLPQQLRERLQRLASEQRKSISSVVRELLERAIVEGSPNASGTIRQVAQGERVSAYLGPEDVRRIQTYAAKSGLTKASAFAALLRAGLEVSDEREGIPGSRVDELRDVLHLIEAFLSRVASTVLGMEVLLAFSVSKMPGIKVSEDEILEQSCLVGEDEWRRVFDEIRHEKADGE